MIRMAFIFGLLSVAAPGAAGFRISIFYTNIQRNGITARLGRDASPYLGSNGRANPPGEPDLI
jgi:hypothetical protein